MQQYNKQSLCFDDILLVPQHSAVPSRFSIDLTMHGYKFPIVSSPMDTVTEVNMAAEIAYAGGIGIIHRYMDTSERLVQLQSARAKSANRNNVGIAISAIESLDTQFINDIVSIGATWVCVDTANGHSDACIKAVEHLKNNYPTLKIMAGNISTPEGFVNLANAGAHAVRVGIGGGATCTTRIVSGHGVPTLQSIIDCYEIKNKLNLSTLIVADGGIKTTGDIVKSFAAGADLVMLGSMLAGTDESPGEIIDGYKVFRGMASEEAQNDWRGTVSVAEGVSTRVPVKGPVKGVIGQIRGGLGSGCSYSGVLKLSELAENAEYTLVTPLSMGESKPHALNR